MRRIIYILILSSALVVYGQTFTKISIKIGPTLSGQIKTPAIFGDDRNSVNKFGLSATIEPTILTFGSKKQFDFNTDFSFIQKGGSNYSPITTYDQYEQIIGIGGETYPVTINYFSFSPTIKATFWKILFVKVGPRLDIFSNFLITLPPPMVPVDPRTNKDFNSFTYGTTYGVGICVGKNKVKFISEFIGQNDFSNSSYNKLSGQTFKNFCYIINFGITIALRKQDK